jgi:Cof subfamily protein (haloacid dehalogenase superfamily)
MTRAGEIGLLVSDVDGTLVTNDQVLTAAALAAARSLAEAGIGLTLTSARPPHGLRMLVKPLGLRLPLAGFNGGLIVDPEFNVLESHPLDPQIAEDGARLLQESGLDVWVYTGTDWVVSAANGPHVAREASIIEMVPNARQFRPGDFTQAFKIVGISDDYAKVSATRAQVSARLGKEVSASSSEPHFVDITHPKANKGAVVHALASMLALPVSRIATIGDMPNDVLMFAQSGFSIAMGNASADVKAKASVVTASNEQDGFAAAVHRFILAPGGG